MEKIILTDRVRNEKVINTIKDDRHIQLTTNGTKANWIGQVLCINCLIKHVIEGKVEGRMRVTERQGRRHKQLLDDSKAKKGYWKLKEDALDSTLRTTRYGRGYGPVVRQTAE